MIGFGTNITYNGYINDKIKLKMDITKDKGYYESLDKRTKEYRDYKKTALGVGDMVQKGLEKLGLTKKYLQKLGFEDCGCDERREKLNAVFRRLRPKCLEKDEFIWLSELFESKKSRTGPEEQKKLLEIYNRVFGTNKKPSSCSSCVREVRMRLEKLVKVHRNEA